MPQLLNGKNALITGAAGGIGLAIAKKFLYHGANVMLTDINARNGEAALSELQAQYPQKVSYKQLDISDESDVKACFDAFQSEYGPLDILVNNAAIAVAYEVKNFPLDAWRKVFRVNMEGTFLCSQQALRAMIQNNTKGVILNVAAASAFDTIPMQAAYSASKSAILTFARVLALEASAYGIRVNSIAPGATESDMSAKTFMAVAGLEESVIQKNPLGRLGTPDDQANAALFLCSDMASYITGEYLVVSGGGFFNA